MYSHSPNESGSWNVGQGDFEPRRESFLGKKDEYRKKINEPGVCYLEEEAWSFTRRYGSSQGPWNDIFGSEAATLTRERVKERIDTQVAIDDTLYELPDNSELQLGDALIENVGTTVEDLFQVDNITKQEEGDVILEKIKEEHGLEDIKESMDEGKVPESICFFYDGESDNFFRALEFIGLSPVNRGFGAF